MMMRFMGESVTEEEIEVRDKKEQSCAAHYKENPIYVYPEKEARPPSQIPHSCVCERFISSLPRISPHIFLQQNRQTDRGNRSQTHECGIGTEAVEFLFWEYLFQIFGIVYLHLLLFCTVLHD